MNGLVAGFATEEAMEQAFARLSAAGLDSETYSPRRPEQLPSRSWIPLAMLIFGLVAAAGFFALQGYALGINYPFDIGGRPYLSWPAYIPLTFEGGVLLAMIAGFAGFLIACRLPALYDEIDEVDGFREASRDTWFVAVRTGQQDDIHLAHELVAPLGPVVLEAMVP
jgi:hypothetical protein